MTKAPPITADWSKRELLALRPPANITVSEWAARYRVLTSETSARPGPWSNDLLPYLVEPMDSFSNPEVSSTTMLFCTQAGKSECLLNVTGWVIDQSPGPVLIVQPKDDGASRFCYRVQVMIESSDALLVHKTKRARDWKAAGPLRLGSCSIYFAGAGSPPDLAERAIRILLMDEIDKYPAWSGREANPLDLAEERQTTYPDSITGRFTTPVLETDNGWRHFIASDQRRYHVPCPHCKAYQMLVFSRDRLKFPDDKRDPDEIEEQRLAWYVCEHCEKAIEDDGGHNLRWMLDRGRWCPEGGRVTARGKVIGGKQSRHRGYQLNALYSPFRGWSKVAAKFLRSKDDATSLMNFTNSWLALPWAEAQKGLDEDELRRRCDDRRAGVVPSWDDVVLTCGIDVGGPEHGPYIFDYVVRAWGPQMKSALVIYGRVIGYKHEMMQAVFGPTYSDGYGRPHRVQLALIDERWQPATVRDYCRGEEPHLFPSQGHEHLRTPFHVVEVDGLQVHQLDTNYLKDYMVTLMAHPAEHPSAWSLHGEVDEVYLTHLQTEHKVPARKRATARVSPGKPRLVWKPKLGMGSPHWWDGEVYALAAAMRLGLHHMAQEVPVAGTAGERSEFHTPHRHRMDDDDVDGWDTEMDTEGWLDDD